MYASWQTIAPQGNAEPGHWQVSAARYFCWAFALGFLAMLFVLWTPPGISNWRRGLSLLLILATLGAVLLPEVWQFLRIDHCLDMGGAWSYEQGKCDGVRDASHLEQSLSR